VQAGSPSQKKKKYIKQIINMMCTSSQRKKKGVLCIIVSNDLVRKMFKYKNKVERFLSR
jgi:hypothetical protein